MSSFAIIISGIIMIAGKVIGGVIGLFNGGFIGALIGGAVGHMFDRGMNKFSQEESPEALQAVQHSFFNTTFTLIGYLAKADGRVSEDEIDETQQLMERMGLTANHKREAIRLFKVGATPNFTPIETLENFKEICGKRVQLIQMLMVYLVNTALADGKLDEKEEAALRKIAQALHFSHLAFEQLLKMVHAQSHFSSGAHQQHQSYTGELEQAYKALGVNSGISDKDLKKSYRKLISEYHPDKLIGQGVPDDMIKIATERSQKIRAAYDIIQQSRQ